MAETEDDKKTLRLMTDILFNKKSLSEYTETQKIYLENKSKNYRLLSKVDKQKYKTKLRKLILDVNKSRESTYYRYCFVCGNKVKRENEFLELTKCKFMPLKKDPNTLDPNSLKRKLLYRLHVECGHQIQKVYDKKNGGSQSEM